MSNRKKLGIVAGIVSLAAAAATVLATIISYPTTQHITIAQSMNSSPEKTDFDRLMASPEASWSIYSSLALVGVQMVLSIIAVYLVYRYIRKYRLSKNAAGNTVGIFVVAGLVSYFVGAGFRFLYGVASLSDTNMPLLITGAVVSTIMSFLVTFIVTLLIEKLYNRSHGFLAD